MQQPLVSVSIITYNHGPYIRQCLESVIAQKTNFSFEVIIGEDCSTDNTRVIVREFEAKYPDIIKPIYHQQNVGMMRNGFEFCYQACKGKYIASLEGDDYWCDPYKLQFQVDFLETHHDYVLCSSKCNTYIEDEDRFDEPYPNLNINTSYGTLDLIKKNLVTTNTTLCRKDKVDIDFFLKNLDLKIGDYGMWLNLSLNGKGFYYNKISSVYRKHKGGVYSQNAYFINAISLLHMFNKLHKTKKFTKYKKHLYNRMMELSYSIGIFGRLAGNQKNYIKYFVQSMKYSILILNFTFFFKCILRIFQSCLLTATTFKILLCIIIFNLN